MDLEKIQFEEIIKNNQKKEYIFDKDNTVIIKNIIFVQKITLLNKYFIKDTLHSVERVFSNLNLKTESNSSIILSKDKKYKYIKFENCIFEEELLIEEEPVEENRYIEKISFDNCQFKKNIDMLLKKRNIVKNIFFDSCELNKFYLSTVAQNFDNDITPFELYGGEIKNLTIHDKKIKEKFYINKQYSGNKKKTIITNLSISKTTFKKNFKLHNCHIENIVMEDVDFNKHADFFKSIFSKGLNQNIYFKAINFKGLALFGDCIFKEKLIFEYITFESFSHFRRTKFYKGLDLDYTNIQEEMNFFSVKELDSIESITNTSQETYRIIKHNFEKINNKVEANNYHALELQKKKEILVKKVSLKFKYYVQNCLLKLWGSKPYKYSNKINQKIKKDPLTNKELSEILILQLHWKTSRNGTNWLIPLLLIVIVSLLTTIGLHWERVECLIRHPFDHFEDIKNGLLSSFKYTYILYKNNDLWNNNPIIFAFNKFSLGYLYYQFLIAVRKDTRK